MGEGQGGGGSNHQNYHFLLQQHHHQQQLRPAPISGGSYKMRGGCGGEIVEVQGGHIMRSTGRKDRHSKVCTAKGPRDRRVRLSAHTAIQFYDVQDRLGYDRPSKAVDWLIKNAKAAIDELEKLPPWHPTTGTAPATEASTPEQKNSSSSTNPESAAAVAMDEVQHINNAETAGAYDGFVNTPSSSSAAFFPPSLDSDSIADTIKSFFPIAGTTSSTIGFQTYQTAAAADQHQPLPFPPKANPGAQDQLRLSLQSYQDPMLVQHNSHNPATSTAAEAQHHNHSPFFSTSASVATAPLPLVYDAVPTNGWMDHSHPRGAMASWIASGGGYVFSVPQPSPLHPALSQSSPQVTQRGPLQSSNPATNFAWVEQSASVLQEHGGVYGSAFGFNPATFSSYHIPNRGQGEEEQDGFDKPSSGFSLSRH